MGRNNTKRSEKNPQLEQTTLMLGGFSTEAIVAAVVLEKSAQHPLSKQHYLALFHTPQP